MDIFNSWSLRSDYDDPPTPRALLEERIITKVRIFANGLGIHKIERDGECLRSCNRLLRMYSFIGDIYLVSGVSKFVGFDCGTMFHFYFVPPYAKRNSFALNQEDMGFGQYPNFTVEELRTVGQLVC